MVEGNREDDTEMGLLRLVFLLLAAMLDSRSLDLNCIVHCVMKMLSFGLTHCYFARETLHRCLIEN